MRRDEFSIASFIIWNSQKETPRMSKSDKLRRGEVDHAEGNMEVQLT